VRRGGGWPEAQDGGSAACLEEDERGKWAASGLARSDGPNASGPAVKNMNRLSRSGPARGWRAGQRIGLKTFLGCPGKYKLFCNSFAA
jgi:hypothetical protein